MLLSCSSASTGGRPHGLQEDLRQDRGSGPQAGHRLLPAEDRPLLHGQRPHHTQHGEGQEVRRRPHIQPHVSTPESTADAPSPPGSLIEEGGDWDRRNRLKVYQGLYCVAIRDFKQAAELFLDTVSTFTSYELMDYKTFVTYTVYVCMIALKRPDLREKVAYGDASLARFLLALVPNVSLTSSCSAGDQGGGDLGGAAQFALRAPVSLLAVRVPLLRLLPVFG